MALRQAFISFALVCAVPFQAYSAPQPKAAAFGFQSGASEYCLSVMAGFPDDAQSRFTFYHLVELLHEGADPGIYASLDAYSSDSVAAETPVVDVLDYIANPVMRQALPGSVLAHLNHLVKFDRKCGAFIQSQKQTLAVVDPSVMHRDFRGSVLQDALFLRQVMIEAFYQMSAHEDPVHREAVLSLGRSADALRANKNVEAFGEELDELLDEVLLEYNDLRENQRFAVLDDSLQREQVRSDQEMLNQMNKGARTQGYENIAQTIFTMLAY